MGPTPDRPPGCELGPGESMFGSKALKEPQDVVKLQNDISDKMFDILGDSFKREFSNNPNPFDASIISKILSDTRGNSYEYHRFLESFPFTTRQYHDSAASKELKEAGLIFPDFGLGNDDGFFPETIGEACKIQALEPREYNISNEIKPEIITTSNMKDISHNKVKPERETPDFEMKYTTGGVVRYDSVAHISDVLIGDAPEGFDYKSFIISTNRGFSFEEKINVDISREIEEELINHTRDTDLKYKNSVFNYFLNSRMKNISVKPSFDKTEVYRKTSEKIFNEVKNLCVEESSGFLLGFEDEDLTED